MNPNIESFESICREVSIRPDLAESLSLAPSAPLVEHPLDSLLGREHSPYFYLAKRMFDVITELEPKLGKDNVLVGFDELLRIAELTKSAYLDFCKTNSTEPSDLEWRDMLLRSYSLPDKFMAMSNGSWKTFSTAYGLRRGLEYTYPECKFEVSFNKFEEPYFTVSQEGWDIAAEEAKKLGKEVNPLGGHVCPARGRLAKTLWITAVGHIFDEGVLKGSLSSE